MSRSYRQITVHKDWVYSAEKILEVYAISANTLSNWKAQGLRHVEGTRPNLFRGAELTRFHKERARRGRTELRYGEFKCLACKMAVLPDPQHISYAPSKQADCKHARARCSECGAAIFKIVGETECDWLTGAPFPNTSRDISGEEKAQDPADVVISEPCDVFWNPDNERLIYEWLAFAGKYDRKTTLAHLGDIRRFEAAIGFKNLKEATAMDAAAYRERLVSGTRGSAGGARLSASTVRHAASYLKAFFSWLARHCPTARLEAVASYFELPKSCLQSVMPKADKQYVSLETAAQALGQMPSKTLINRRDRAIFALAYIGAVRESALITLRLRHIDVAGRSIEHNGRELRAKNGKSFRIRWFTGTEDFVPALTGWIEELISLGAGPEDALFPQADILSKLSRSSALEGAARPVWPPMKSAHSVGAAFKRASALIGVSITPHSARHTIAALSSRICQSAEERKAWSLNMGHDSEATTYGNYGKMSADQKDEVLKALELSIGSRSVRERVRKDLQVKRKVERLIGELASLVALMDEEDLVE